jgi:hypothetical protein
MWDAPQKYMPVGAGSKESMQAVGQKKDPSDILEGDNLNPFIVTIGGV